jgi:hypothetical protein
MVGPFQAYSAARARSNGREPRCALRPALRPHELRVRDPVRLIRVDARPLLEILDV